MSEVTLYLFPLWALCVYRGRAGWRWGGGVGERGGFFPFFAGPWLGSVGLWGSWQLQGYLAHKKQPPP